MCSGNLARRRLPERGSVPPAAAVPDVTLTSLRRSALVRSGQGNPKNLYGEYAFGACVGGTDARAAAHGGLGDQPAPPASMARCAYYTLVDEPVARMVEEVRTIHPPSKSGKTYALASPRSVRVPRCG